MPGAIVDRCFQCLAPVRCRLPWVGRHACRYIKTSKKPREAAVLVPTRSRRKARPPHSSTTIGYHAALQNKIKKTSSIPNEECNAPRLNHVLPPSFKGGRQRRDPKIQHHSALQTSPRGDARTRHGPGFWYANSLPQVSILTAGEDTNTFSTRGRTVRRREARGRQPKRRLCQRYST